MNLYPADSISNSPVLYDGYQKVNGMNGAMSLLTRPNSKAPAFDSNDDVFYDIVTDINNNKTVRRFRFFEEPEPKPEDIFASKQEISQLKGELGDVKQSIQSLTELTANIAAAISANATGEPQSGADLNVQKSVSKSKGNNRSNESITGPGESDTRSSKDN